MCWPGSGTAPEQLAMRTGLLTDPIVLVFDRFQGCCDLVGALVASLNSAQRQERHFNVFSIVCQIIYPFDRFKKLAVICYVDPSGGQRDRLLTSLTRLVVAIVWRTEVGIVLAAGRGRDVYKLQAPIDGLPSAGRHRDIRSDQVFEQATGSEFDITHLGPPRRL